MKFFLDTANIEQIRTAQEMGILDGVTTNPSLMAKEGIKGDENILDHYLKICELVSGDVSAEVISTDYQGMIREGEKLASLHKQIVVKIPVIPEGIKAIRYLSEKDIRTNCTLIFNAGQALLAAKAGASYVSPFIGRLDDIGENGMDLIVKLVHIFDLYGFETEIIAASVRNTSHILQCLEAGVHVATCPLQAITGLLNHPLTDAGLEKFLSDHRKMNG
jgi:transaldolase